MDRGPEPTREYVRKTAAGGLEDLIALVEADTVRLHAAAMTFSDADLDRALDGDWTPSGCLAHIVARSTLRAREVLYVALSGELPPEEPLSLPGDRAGLVAKHREAIDSLYVHVRDATGDFQAFEWSHPAFGPMNWKEWLVFIHVHIADHASQLAAMALLSPKD